MHRVLRFSRSTSAPGSVSILSLRFGSVPSACGSAFASFSACGSFIAAHRFTAAYSGHLSCSFLCSAGSPMPPCSTFHHPAIPRAEKTPMRAPVVAGTSFMRQPTNKPATSNPKLALSHGGVKVRKKNAFHAMTSKVTVVGQARGGVTGALRRSA